MSKYKICVYAIAKNEEQFVEKWFNSMNEADMIVVADTGSSDHTIQKLKALGVKVESITISPWRFDLARNKSMDLIPEDFDICVCTDLDEVFDPGWRDKLEAAWTPTTTRVKYNYTYGFYPNGTPIVTFLYEKIHRRNDFRWIYPVHEILDYSGDIPDTYTVIPEIHLKHYPDLTKSRSNYLTLLELSAKEFPKYDRNIHYLGREYMFHQRFQEAIDTLQYHLSLDSAKWEDERCASMRYISRCYLSLGNLLECKRWLFRAIGEAPHLREPYVEMAKLAYIMQDWACVFDMVNSALQIEHKSGTYLDDENCWGSLLYDYGAICCYQLGLFTQSLSYAKDALKMDPENKRLQENLHLIEAHINEMK